MIMNETSIDHVSSHTRTKSKGLIRLVQIGTKVAIGMSLMAAGAALAQNVGLVPDLMPKEATVTAPTKAELDVAPAPGTQREAKACSDDIKMLCAPQTASRRDVLQCFEDKDAQVSQSCKSYLKRFEEELAD
jgi:hypothetical protein